MCAVKVLGTLLTVESGAGDVKHRMQRLGLNKGKQGVILLDFRQEMIENRSMNCEEREENDKQVLNLGICLDAVAQRWKLAAIQSHQHPSHVTRS